MSVAYKVLAPCVILVNDEGVRREVYQGAVVEVVPDQVEHLLGLGFIAKEGTAAAVIPVENVGNPDAFPMAPKPDPPLKSATQKAWVDFAVSAHGADRAEAEALTRADLVELYG